MLREKLASLKETSKMTVRQISEKSGVPVSTVTRVLSGETMNPSFEVIKSIVQAMGGSVDEVADLVAKPAPAPVQAPAPSITLPDFQQLMIPFYERALAVKDKWITRLFCCCVGLVLFLMLLLVFDIFTPNLGWFRY